jgi:hypothetical protein
MQHLLEIADKSNFCVVRFEKVFATGIKSNDRCRDAGDECVGYYDASILTRFWPSKRSNS